VVGNTQKSKITGSLSNAPVNVFSDIEVHHMGAGLADNVSQGGAGGDQFRTAPLWGLGQRIFLAVESNLDNLFQPAAGPAQFPALAVIADPQYPIRNTWMARLLARPESASPAGSTRGNTA
jgi:hypothetical protein